MSKYGHRTMNWFEAIVNKLGGEEAGDAFLCDELIVSKPCPVVGIPVCDQIDYQELARFVTSDGKITLENFKKALKPVWKTWKTIKLGTLKNAEEIRQALKASGNNIGNWVNDILGKPTFTVSKTEQEVELVNVSVEELGFKGSACYADICKRALELGLDLCPAEVGPQLRLQWKDQPKGTYVVVAMNAITDSDGFLSVFSVECDGGGDRYLRARSGDAGRVWDADRRFVFQRRKAA